MSEFTTLLPGDPIPTSARVWNPILDAARAHRERTPTLSDSEQNVDNVPTNTILVHNTTDTNRVRGTTMKLLRAYANNVGSFDSRFVRRKLYPAVQSDARSTSLVRLIDSIPAGKVGRAQYIAPYADVDTGTVGHVRRFFGSHRVLGLPFLRCGEFDWVRWNGGASQLTPWNVNSGGLLLRGIISNPFNIANNSQYFYRLPFLKLNTTATTNAHVVTGVQAHHMVHAFASVSSNFVIKIPRRTIQSSGTTVGWSYDGLDCSVGEGFADGNFRASGQTIPPIFVPRMVTGVVSSVVQYASQEPPAFIEHFVNLTVGEHVVELPAGGTFFCTWRFQRVPAYGSADSQPIEVLCRSCQTGFVVYDVDDTVDAGGVINPPTSPGTAGVLASVVASGSATLQLSGGAVGGGGGIAVLPPAETTYSRFSQAAAGTVAEATGPNATHTLSPGIEE